MKLLTKTNSYTVTITLLLFAVGSFVIYQFILNKLDHEVDERLLYAKTQVIQGLKNGILPNEFIGNIGEKIYVSEVKTVTLKHDIFHEYKSKNPQQDDYDEVNRELIFQVAVNGKYYEGNISSSVTEGKRLSDYIILVVFVIVLINIVVLFILNRVVSATVFSPFYDTLSKIKTWNIKRSESLNFKETNIEEFNLLNDTVKDLTQQIKSDYKRLKEFTENVSHEAQTPLSIISTKLELLMQQINTFNTKQAEQLQQIYQATQRLYKLNQALILLSRIENKQFVAVDKVNLNASIDEKLELLEDFTEAKNITIQKEYKTNLVLDINQYLVTILLNNLLTNAIKYSPDEGGVIKIVIEETYFSIENISLVDKIEKDYLFERFNKTSTSGSLGVGLSLIKKIVDFYNWQISYSYKDNLHRFKILV